MNILIITAAGRASRFHDVGYDIPKYLLPWTNGKNILTNIMDELCYESQIDFILVISNYREKYFKSEIEKCIPKDTESSLIFVKDTLGQAHTTFLGVEELIKRKLDNHPMIVHNSDTILKNRNIKELCNFKSEKDLIGYINTFQSIDNKYSYVLESQGYVKTFLEKKTVSPLASSGLVSFCSARKFQEIYNYSQENSETAGELYMSEVINASIKKGDLYKINHSDSIKDTIVLGTPEEYCRAYTLASTGLDQTE